jgi:hypothetical protein
MSTEHQPLSGEKAQQIAAALARFREIGNNKIINPRDEAEITGLKNFFSQVIIEHGNELLGNWIVVRQEYEPLVQTVERIADRIVAIRTNRNNERAAATTAAQLK